MLHEIVCLFLRIQWYWTSDLVYFLCSISDVMASGTPIRRKVHQNAIRGNCPSVSLLVQHFKYTSNTLKRNPLSFLLCCGSCFQYPGQVPHRDYFAADYKVTVSIGSEPSTDKVFQTAVTFITLTYKVPLFQMRGNRKIYTRTGRSWSR
jgi:hypothetical protein